jgi:hypothetical protein
MVAIGLVLEACELCVGIRKGSVEPDGDQRRNRFVARSIALDEKHPSRLGGGAPA